MENELEKEFGENNYNVDDSDNTNWILSAKGQSVTIPAGSTIVEEGIYAPYDTPYIPTNFTHTTGTWNTGFTIKGDIGSVNENDEFVWVPCVLDLTKTKPGDTVQIFERHFSNLTDETDPDKNDAEHRVYWGIDYANSYSDVDTSAGDIRTSVGTYGGFYIAKYEASQDNGTAKSISGANVWNYISLENAIVAAEEMIHINTGCKSALVSGECWDTTMQWIKQTTGTNYDIDSTGKGYYENNSQTTTGSNSNYAVNNIYDMAGNVDEWVSEGYTPPGLPYSLQEIRGGGSQFYDCSEYPAGCRISYTSGTQSGIGFRVVLYK